MQLLKQQQRGCLSSPQTRVLHKLGSTKRTRASWFRINFYRIR